MGAQVEQNQQQQSIKIKELEAVLLTTTRTCSHFEKLLQQELASRAEAESDNERLNQTVSRLKAQVAALEKGKAQSEEMIRALNATLMERETEISILKLKMTRLQTSLINPSSSLKAIPELLPTTKDPRHIFATSGRSNSEFSRNSLARSTMIADSTTTRGSASTLKTLDRDASIWARIPEELTPSRRPAKLQNGLPPHSSYSAFGNINGHESNNTGVEYLTSTPILSNRNYRTMPRSMRSPTHDVNHEQPDNSNSKPEQENETEHKPSQQKIHCQVTNLDDSNNTSHSSQNRSPNEQDRADATQSKQVPQTNDKSENTKPTDHITESNYAFINENHYASISKPDLAETHSQLSALTLDINPKLSERTPSTPVKFGLKKIFDRFRRSDSTTSSQSRTDLDDYPISAIATPFKRGATRSTVVGGARDIRAHMSPKRQVMNFQTDKPFAEWDTDMLVDWLTMIGLSMYASQCRRWVKCGAHIMNATPAEVDKGLGITNHLHRKKLRLAISELNGDCDKITKSAAKLDYLWVARWLDDIGLPQYKEAFINARVDGRVLNYLTVEDLLSMNIKSVLHHASIRCGIRVLRSIEFDLQSLKRRATSDEIEKMKSMRPKIGESPDDLRQDLAENNFGDANLHLWTCYRVMDWLRLIDFAEFAPNLRGSGVHGGLIAFEDGFNVETMCSLLSIQSNKTLLRRHLQMFFINLIGDDLAAAKREYQNIVSNTQLNPLAEIKNPKKSQFWLGRLKGSKVAQDATDEYLCPMYPVEPILKSPTRRNEQSKSQENHLGKIPESINV